MSVTNGETANQTTFNNAFMSRTGDTDTIGKVEIKETTDSTSVDSGALQVDGGVGVAKNVHIGGNLTVEGTTTTIESQTVEVADANITVNKGGTKANANANDAGITVEMSDATDVVFGYNSSFTSRFQIGDVGSEKEVIDAGSLQTLVNKTFDDEVTIQEISTPSTPATGYQAIYPKTDGKWYSLDDAGIETEVGKAIGAYQEKLGTGNGINTVFPLAMIPVSEASVLVFSHLIQYVTDEWTYNSIQNQIEFVTAPALGVEVYTYYLTEGSVITVPTPTGTQNVVYHTVTVGEAAAKQLTLSVAPAIVTNTIVDIIGGSSQHFGIDFSISGAVFDWNGYGLDGNLASGDVIRFNYFS